MSDRKVTQIVVTAGKVEPSLARDFASIRREVSFTLEVDQPMNTKTHPLELAKITEVLQKLAADTLSTEMKVAHRAEGTGKK